MNEISNVNGPNRLPSLDLQRVERLAANRARLTGRAEDTVELSELAVLLSRLDSVPEIRAPKVAHIRAEIENGTYETPEKLEATVTRLLEEL